MRNYVSCPPITHIYSGDDNNVTSTSSPLSVTVQSGTSANVNTIYSYTVTYDHAGNVLTMADAQDLTGTGSSVMGTWTYAYDTLNRLISGTALAGPYAANTVSGNGYPYLANLSWSYDNFGNRTDQSLSGGSTTLDTAATYLPNNQTATLTPAGQTAPITPTYDAAGNVTANDGAPNTYLYDAEGRVCAIDGPSGITVYQYDADGNRIGKGTAATLTCDVTDPSYQPTNDYVLDLGNSQMTELTIANGAPSWDHTNAMADGALVSTYDMQGWHFYLNDPLGTRRAQTNAAGSWEQNCLSLPYGDQLSCTASTTAPTEHHFTGKERDTESGNDYFGARYYGSNMGRFMSPDPSGLVFASFANPQSLNLYSYAQNNPLIYSDPTGLDCAYLNNSGSGVESFDQHSSSGECGKTGGYWVDGGLTDAKINADKGTVQLTGTNDGTDVTHASYKDTSVYVDSWLNTSLNEAGHITMGLVGQQQVGQNPRSDAAFLSNMLVGGLKYNVVPGAIQPETPGQLRSFALIPVTGMQAQMIQNSINQSTAAPPNYSLNPALGLDCATWAQQVLKDAGIQTGPMQPYPNDLMKQLSNQFSVLPGHQ